MKGKRESKYSRTFHKWSLPGSGVDVRLPKVSCMGEYLSLGSVQSRTIMGQSKIGFGSLFLTYIKKILHCHSKPCFYEGVRMRVMSANEGFDESVNRKASTSGEIKRNF